MIGLSLSLCVSDIARGKVKEEDVECIISSTKMRTQEDVDKVLKQYSKTYWENLPGAIGIARRIPCYQPRLYGAPGHSVGGGIWIDNEIATERWGNFESYPLGGI